MQSKRDQVQAHLFLMSRLTSGMLRANPDQLEAPGRRTNRGMVFGTIVAALAVVVALLWGVFSPGTPSTWRKEGTLVMEEDTGNRYIYAQGRLRSILNYSSARLLMGPNSSTANLASSAIGDVPRGPAVGIPGAPDSLPGPDRLVTSPWQMCAASSQKTSGEADVHTRLAIGATHRGRPLGGGEALLVQGPDGRQSLVWSGQRFLLDDTSGARASLGYGSAVAHPVSAAYLAALPAGPDIAAPSVTGRGSAGPELDGTPTRIGQVFELRVPGSPAQFQLLLQDGLVPLDTMQTALVLGDPRTRDKAYAGTAPLARPIGADTARSHQAPTASRPSAEALPPSPPRLADIPAGTQPCIVVRPSTGKGIAVSVALVPAAVPADYVTQPPTDHVAAACLPVDRVEIRPGRGAVVQALSSAGTEMGDTRYLVTDSGVRYPIASEDTLTALGYTPADVRGVPAALLMTLPTGATLDPGAAALSPPDGGDQPSGTCPGVDGTDGSGGSGNGAGKATSARATSAPGTATQGSSAQVTRVKAASLRAGSPR
ncbi:type VII secretion protein EccB [Streptomyces sp. NPDC048297]|uniref:type VII secretion protein EccB n=1 Tax=Streptomyces sp. NPDC048297 TaxID=3365531 RepID=UPI0037168AFD